MINYISSYKVNFVSPAKAVQLAGNMPGEKHKAEIYAMYEKYKEDHNMMDFDDLLLNTLKIFQDNPDIVSRWSRRYQFVHVDEFQDVGSIEYNLIHYSPLTPKLLRNLLTYSLGYNCCYTPKS